MRQGVILLFLMLLGALKPVFTQTHPIVLVAGSNPTLTTMSAAVVARDTIVAPGEVIEYYGQPSLVRVGGMSVHVPLHPVCAPAHERTPGRALGRRVGPEVMVLTGALPTRTTWYRISFKLPSVGDSVTLVGYNRYFRLKEGVPRLVDFREHPWWSLRHQHLLLLRDDLLEGDAQLRQRPIPPEPPQPGFDVQQGCGQPPMFLVARGPAIDFAHPLLHQGEDGLVVRSSWPGSPPAARPRPADEASGSPPDPRRDCGPHLR